MKLMKKIETITCSKTIFISLTLLLFVIIMVNFVFPSKIPYLTQTFNYSYTQAYETLTDYGLAGRNQHLLVLITDIIMVVLYTIFLSTSITSIFKVLFTKKSILHYVRLLPFILAFIQGVEIIGVFTMLVLYPASNELLYSITNMITMVKTILTTICFLIPLIGIILVTIVKISVRTKKIQ